MKKDKREAYRSSYKTEQDAEFTEIFYLSKLKSIKGDSDVL